MRRPLAALAAAVVMAGSAVGAPAVAAADGPLAPGQTRTVTLAVPGTWAEQAAQVGVTVHRLAQAENGCLEVEAAAGDDCTSDVGELAGKLTTTVAWGRTVEGTCRAGGPAVPLDLFGRSTARLTEVGGIDCLLLAMTFPHGESDNLAQSDTLTFGLVLVGQGLGNTGGTAGEADPGSPAPSGDGVRGTAAGPQGAEQQVTGQQQGAGRPDPVPAGTAGGAVTPGAVTGTADGGAAAGTAGGGATDGAADAGADGGPVLDRVEAQVAVGGEGVGVQTQAVGTSLQVLVLVWGGALLGMVGLGWWLFLLLRRRRRAEVAA